MGTRDRLEVRVNDELVLDAGTCEKVSGPQGPERLERARADAERYPSRVLANALVNTAWRNGPAAELGG